MSPPAMPRPGARRAGRLGLTLQVFLLPFLLSTACQSLNSPYPDSMERRSLVVHGMLIAERAEQEVLVEYTRTVSEGYYLGLTPASGSEVSVTTAGEADTLVEDPAQRGVFRGTFTPRSGERYTLRVRGPAGELATATAVVPGVPTLLLPHADTVVPYSPAGTPIQVVWSSAPAAAYVLVEHDPVRDTLAGDIYNLFYRPLDLDTTVTVREGGPLSNPLGHRYSVAAVDSNFVRYYRDDDVTAMPRRSTVQGAYGVFGSVAYSREMRAILLEQQP